MEVSFSREQQTHAQKEKVHNYAKYANIYGAALKHRIRNPAMESWETEYGICERWFQAINLKKNLLAMTIKINE